MRATNWTSFRTWPFVAVACLMLPAIARAQVPDLAPLTPVRILEGTTIHQAHWVGATDSTLILQRDGIRSTISLAAVDSIQHWVQSRKLARDFAIVGAAFVGAVFVGFSGGMCDLDCTGPLLLAGGAGIALGALSGAVIGSLTASARGRWVTIYRRI